MSSTCSWQDAIGVQTHLGHASRATRFGRQYAFYLLGSIPSQGSQLLTLVTTDGLQTLCTQPLQTQRATSQEETLESEIVPAKKLPVATAYKQSVDESWCFAFSL